MTNFRRSGDVNLHPVKEVKGKLILKTRRYVLAKGEATGSEHALSTCETDIEIYQEENGKISLRTLEAAPFTHTHDHETTILQPGNYRQVGEREMDHFSQAIRKKVD